MSSKHSQFDKHSNKPPRNTQDHDDSIFSGGSGATSAPASSYGIASSSAEVPFFSKGSTIAFLSGCLLLLAMTVLFAYTFWRRRRRLSLAADRQLRLEIAGQQQAQRIIAMLAKEKDRKELYVEYLKPSTMTVTSDDLTCTEEPVVSIPESTTPSEEPRDLETGDAVDVEEEVASVASDSEEPRFLRLPACAGPDLSSPRTVEAECAICCSCYEVGDEVVWSRMECSHAFHRDCLLPWISKGKKHCPLCRSLFVPDTAIEEICVQQQEKDDYRATTEQDESSESPDNISTDEPDV
eukprot:Nitzschia sp. Nitz4//scaffold92_size79448//65072//66043//NITZ4_005401-RA/size79448-augustus-gene-0.34-mRNA-1//-1//CDS//3329560216//7037//frame0